MASAALLLLLLARLAAQDVKDVDSSMIPEDADLDEESDSAAFMIVVEHEDEWRCSGSLLSQRTVVTTAQCALGRQQKSGKDRELLALASALLAPRTPVSLAAAARRVRRFALSTAAPPTLNLALLELERPFDGAAAARPILLATSRNECERARQCNAVRSLAARHIRRRVRLRVVDVAIVDNVRCADRVLRWPTPPQGLVCYAGDELCENDLGGGVVCDGKLCGVLGATAAGARCSTTYAAVAVAHWHRFLLCAHTPRLYGRGDCSALYSEHRLIPDDGVSDDNDPRNNRVFATVWNEEDMTVTRSNSEETTRALTAPTRTLTHAPSTAAAVATALTVPVGRSVVFEPNRADFKVTPPRTTLVRLKAGEYGDNAAEYEGEEMPPPPTRTSIAVHPSEHALARASIPPTDQHRPPSVERRVSPPARSVAPSNNAWCQFTICILLIIM